MNFYTKYHIDCQSGNDSRKVENNCDTFVLWSNELVNTLWCAPTCASDVIAWAGHRRHYYAIPVI